MVKDEKDIIRQKQLPGSNFNSGNLTLFQIAESNGTQLGRPQTSYSDAQVSDRDKEILAKAIPANKVESILQTKVKSTPKELDRKVKSIIKRGMLMRHKNGTKVVVVEADVDTTSEGIIRHRVMAVGTDKKYLVPENKLEVLKNA